MINLTPRLSAAAQLVREGSVLADIGCDHGFLPVYLLQSGKIKGAVASDVNEGPLNSCRLLVKECGFENEVRCVLSNGLEGISQNDCSDISICGMGAELIVKILSSCSWTENKEKHFIFNPMTHSEILRRYLCENGFEIQNDIIVKEGNRYYNVLDAYYTGDIVERSEAYYYLGEIKSFEHKEYFYHLLNYLENKEKGGADNQEVICAIKKLL